MMVMALLFGVIADDFTGACDAGVQFRKRGLETVVLADVERLGDLQRELDLVVIDTESRDVSPETAYGKVRHALRELKKISAQLVYKKIDSTLRGNLGAELDATIDELRVEAVIVAPSFPAHNRTTVDGHLLVHNTPLERTEFARDAVNPLKESFIPKLLGRQTKRGIGHIGLRKVRSGVHPLECEIRRLVKQGYQIVVVDAETDEDLARIAGTVDSSVLPCGSAGLAEHIAGLMTSRTRLLVVSGSMNSATLGQIAEVEKSGRAKVLELDLSGVLAEQGNLDVAVKDIVDEADRAVAGGKDVVITLARSEASVLELHELGKELGMSRNEVNERLGFILSESFRKVVVTHRFAGLVLVGGDTSIRMISALGASGVRLESEVLPGIPAGRILGGEHDGMRVITKAGGFGDSHTLVKIMECMRSAVRP